MGKRNGRRPLEILQSSFGPCLRVCFCTRQHMSKWREEFSTFFKLHTRRRRRRRSVSSLERVRFCCCGVTGDDGWVHGEEGGGTRPFSSGGLVFCVQQQQLKGTRRMNSSSSHFSHGVKEEEEKKKKKIPKGDQSDGFLSNDSRHVTNPPSSSSLTHAHKSLPASPLMDDRSRKSPFRIVFYSLLNRFSQVLS